MKINKHDLIKTNNLREHLVVSALTNTLKDEEFHNFIKDKWDENEEVEVKLLVQGVELDITKTCEQWNNQMDRLIAEKASALIEEKFGNITNFLYNIEKDIRRKVKKELGLNIDEFDY